MTATAPETTGRWHLCRDGHQVGPMSLDEVEGLLASGRVLPTDDVWTDGFTDWRPASEAFPDAFPPTTTPPVWLTDRAAPSTEAHGGRLRTAATAAGSVMVLVASFWLALRYLPDGDAPPARPPASVPAASIESRGETVVSKNVPGTATKEPPPWRYPAPMTVLPVSMVPAGTNVEIRPPAEFEGIVPSKDPNAQFVRFVSAYLKGYRKGWRYDVGVKWTEEVVVRRILINRRAECALQGRAGKKWPSDDIDNFVNLCDGTGIAKEIRDPGDPYPAIAGTTNAPVPIHEIAFETDRGTFSYDTRGLVLRQQRD